MCMQDTLTITGCMHVHVFSNKGGVTMQLFLEATPIILKYDSESPKLEDTYYSQVIPGIIFAKA